MQCHYDGLSLGRFQCGGSDVAFPRLCGRVHNECSISALRHVLRPSSCLLSQPVNFLFRSLIPIPPPTCHISSFLLQSSLYSYRSIFVVRAIYSIITTYVVVGISRTPTSSASREGSATEFGFGPVALIDGESVDLVRHEHHTHVFMRAGMRRYRLPVWIQYYGQP